MKAAVNAVNCLNVSKLLSTLLLMFLMQIFFAVWKWYFCIHIWEDTYDGTAISDVKTDAAIKERKGKRGRDFGHNKAPCEKSESTVTWLWLLINLKLVKSFYNCFLC